MVLVLVLLIVIVAVLVAMATSRKSRGNGDNAPWPFYARKPLTRPEQVLYFRLRQALPDHIILAQVSLSRILGVRKGNNFGEWFNRINRMSADFVICQKDSSIVAVIELDDASHTKAVRQLADARKDRALVSAGIRVLRWRVNAIPDEAVIASVVLHADHISSAHGPDSASVQCVRGKGIE